MRFFSRFASLMWLGILTLLFSIPVVTAGASFTAMFAVVFRMRGKQEGYVWQSFWHSFKQNFLQSTLLWLLMAAGFCILYGDYVILTKSIYHFPVPFKVASGLVAFIFLMACTFVFPLQARFENTWRQVIKNSFLMGMFHLPKTMLVVLLHIIPFVILRWFPMTFPAILVLGLSGPAYLNAPLLLGVFSIYTPEQEQEENVRQQEK